MIIDNVDDAEGSQADINAIKAQALAYRAELNSGEKVLGFMT